MAQRRAQKKTPGPFEDGGGALEEALPGVRMLDQDLELEGGGRADAAGVDNAGRIVLALVAGDDEDATALAVLEALSSGRRHADLIGRHLGARRVRADLGPRVVLVVPPEAERLVGRLAALRGQGLEILEIRGVKSRRGERSYLVPVETGDVVDLRPDPGAEAFLDALPPEGEAPLSEGQAGLRELGELLVERMGRLDDELSVRASTGAVAWSLGEEVLVRAEQKGETLRASVGPAHKARAVTSVGELEAVLEAAMERMVELLDHAPPPPKGGLEPPPGAAGPPEEPGGRSPGEVAEEGVLTDDELEAFRD